MNRAEICIDWLLEVEGFYSNDLADRGGATKYGISLRFLGLLPNRQGDLDGDGDVDIDDVRFMSLDRARLFYLTEFWSKSLCTLLQPGLDVAVFCASVNHGVEQSTRLLQAALKVPADGRIGKRTLAAADAVHVGEFLPDLLSHRARFYADIVRADSSQAKWERGWYRRLFLLQQFATCST